MYYNMAILGCIWIKCHMNDINGTTKKAYTYSLDPFQLYETNLTDQLITGLDKNKINI